MGDREKPNMEDLVRRFDAGDRSPDLLAQLNQEAFDCFHAPWEALPDLNPAPRGLRAPNRVQGRLPMGDEDDELDELQIPSFFEPIENLDASDSSCSHPLGRLFAALESMGRAPHHAAGKSLLVELDHDPRADNQTLLTFRAHGPERCIELICRGDLALSGLSEMVLQRICHAHNHRATGLHAEIFRPQVGCSPRLRLRTTLAFESIQSLPPLAEHLAGLFQENLRFWRLVRRHRPI